MLYPIRKYLSEYEESKTQVSNAKKEHGEFIARLCESFDSGLIGEKLPQELLLSKVCNS